MGDDPEGTPPAKRLKGDLQGEGVVCEKCQQCVPLWSVEEHKDYHFALELQRREMEERRERERRERERRERERREREEMEERREREERERGGETRGGKLQSGRGRGAGKRPTKSIQNFFVQR